jgi:hypothetical protein
MFTTTHKIQGAGGAGGEDSYWLTTIRKSGVNILNFGINADTSNSVYGIGTDLTSGYLLKFEEDGSLAWNKTLQGTGVTQFISIIPETSGSIWVSGLDNGANPNRGLLAKYSSDGTLQLQKIYGGSGASNITDHKFNFLSQDSSGNLFASGPMKRSSGNQASGIVKLNSSGVIQWQIVSYDSIFNDASDTTVDSSNNVYQIVVGNGGDKVFVIKRNSSGTVLNSFKLLGNQSISQGCSIDSSDNLYVSFNTTTFTGGNIAGVVKVNSSGTVQWCRTLAVATNLYSDNVLVDSNDDVYLTFSNVSSSDRDLIIVKYNSSGSLQWQRSLGSTGSEIVVRTNLDNNNNLLVSFSTDAIGSDRNSVYAKLPSDGSGTGTYGSFVYAASSYTSTSRTISPSSINFTDENLSQPISNLSGTASTNSYTETTYEITP